MSNPSQQRPVVQPVLDRMIDLDPGAAEGAPGSRTQSIRQLKKSLERDLEWLFNTRRTAVEPPESCEELRHSLYMYGLPEFTGMDMASAPDQARLLQWIEAAIATFEPRLTAIKVSLRPANEGERAVYFSIEAILLIDPMPERVAFDTVLELASGAYKIQGDGHA